MKYVMYADHALRLAMMTIIEDFLRKLRVNTFDMTRLLIKLLNVMPNTNML